MEEDAHDEGDDILLSLTGYEIIDGLESKIAQALNIESADCVTVVEEEVTGEAEEDRQVLFVVHQRFPKKKKNDGNINDPKLDLVSTLNNHPLYTKWNCSVVDMEEEVILQEEEAYELWSNMKEEDRTCHLELVPNPDGEMIRPLHHKNFNNNDKEENNNNSSSNRGADAMEDQLRRDPMLLELDNVPRVDCNKLLQLGEGVDEDAKKGGINWDEPFVITGCLSPLKNLNGNKADDKENDNLPLLLLTRDELIERIGSAQVRTGNRNTLIESGFDNSKPLELQKVLCTTTNNGGDGENCFCGTIVFTPIKELPTSFRQDLNQAKLLSCFPSFPTTTGTAHNSASSSTDSQQQTDPNQKQKYTLCVSNQIGFGIGMHKHNQAMFFLLHGKKKWYMAPPTAFEEDDEPTHPGFYTTKSTHKCIQNEGEILYVPDQWYHEIFNLHPYTAGIQALPDL